MNKLYNVINSVFASSALDITLIIVNNILILILIVNIFTYLTLMNKTFGAVPLMRVGIHIITIVI